MTRIKFGKRHIGAGEPVLIIAEIGVNHEGNVETCARMIEEAAQAGADSVKLQTMDPDENYVVGTESYEIFVETQLSQEETAQMFSLARRLGVEPFTTTGDPKTLDWVDRLDPAAHKISSGLMTHIPVIRHAAQTSRSLLISTGMAKVEEIDTAVETARAAGASGIGLFQCTAIYPAPPDSLNLATIGWLERRYDAMAGFSDHSMGNDAAVLSVAAGGKMIEKHFSLDTSRPGLDHHLSLDPESLKDLVTRVRAAEEMLGSAEKNVKERERAEAEWRHRCLVARRDLEAGEIFDESNLACKRPLPGKIGLPPKMYDAVLGQKATRALRMDDPVSADTISEAS
jgi:sialic acid synthase SpsE